ASLPDPGVDAELDRAPSPSMPDVGPDATPDRRAPEDLPPPMVDQAPPERDVGGGPADFWSNPVSGGPAWTGPEVPGTVAVARGSVVGTIAPGFLGLSFEKSHMTDAFFRPDHAPLVALFKLLGPGVLRIGGNDADRTTWDPAALPVMGGTISRTVGTVAVDALAAFLKATGWRVIYAVNYKTGVPENSAAEAKYVAGKLGPSLYGFELGNEINLGGLAYPEAKAKWETLAGAVRAQVPGAPLIGPATNPRGLQTYLVPFARDEAAQVVLLTHHYYRGSGGDAASTIEKLVSPDPHLLDVLGDLATAATTNKIRDGYRLGETASFSSHGAPGVSNAFASALWAIDFSFDNASKGSGGINFHGGGIGMDGNRPFHYSPIGEVKSVVSEARPLFYGMLLVAMGGNGKSLATTAAAGGLSFTAHALLQPDGSVNVFLVNKDPTTAVKATIETGAPVAAGAVVYLEAPSLGATSGVKIAGAGISAAGAWKPGAPYSLPRAGTTVTVTVPPATAALAHVR
ncbi:MAG TPA: hypothetical protein VN914_00790, partial [Polyangia bacterium]|nr:hypothetical protein [Polyangia bacterium]